MHSINNALFVGKVLYELDQIKSTNLFASKLLSKNRPIEGTAIIAYNQTHGRGQIGNNWESEAGKNLTISIILYPDFIKPSLQFILNQAISLAVKKFVEHAISQTVKIKWPNDIYVDDQKIGGILIENTIAGQKITSSVVGIGLNINQTAFSSNLPNPTSFKLIANHDFNIKSAAHELFDQVEASYLKLKGNRLAELRQEYLMNLYRWNVPGQYKIENRLVEGVIRGIKDTGELLLEIDGNIAAHNFKEITFW